MRIISTRSLLRIPLVVIAAGVAVNSSTITAQTPGQPEIVSYVQKGGPPSGPLSVVIEHDPKLTTHTIYRPQDLSKIKGEKLPIIAWGEGGCANNGLEIGRASCRERV